MQKTLIILFVFILGFGLPVNASTAALQNEQPQVNAILFWSNGCPNCAQVLTDILPPLQEKYDSGLNILMIEVVSAEDINTLYSLGSDLGLPKEQIAVPFLLIDHTSLIGADEIQEKFPELVEKHLSTGGLGYPDLPQADKMLPKGIAFTSFDPESLLIPQTANETKATGISLAWGIMVFMVIALILAIVMILRAFQGKPIGKVNRWLDIAIPVLAIIGLIVSLYLTYVEFTSTRALCGPVGDCNAVQNSPYAKLFGVLPIGLAGAIGYIVILVVWLWRHFKTDTLARIAGPAMFGMALFGTLFSIYLTYLELFVIHAVCIWCLSSAILITGLMLLSLPSITQWLAVSDEEE